jgi:hypothetical protein
MNPGPRLNSRASSLQSPYTNDNDRGTETHYPASHYFPLFLRGGTCSGDSFDSFG